MRFQSAACLVLAFAASAVPALAQDFSGSILRPSLVDPGVGMVSGRLPGASGAKIYYFALDLKAGALMTQLQVTGRPGGERRLELQLLDANSRPADSAFVRAGFGAKDETTRSFAIDESGRHVVRVTVEGEETGQFCVLFGGAALPGAAAQDCSAPAAAPARASAPPIAAPPAPAPPRTAEAPPLAAPPPKAAEATLSAAPGELSTSILRPSPVESLDGVILGKLPGSEAAKTYYLSADLSAGILLAQLEIAGRANGARRMTLEVLDADAKAADSTFVRAGFGTKDEATRAFAIDSARRAIFRLIVEGEETGSFCLLLGGAALPAPKPQACPPAALAAAAASTAPDEFSPSIMQPSPIDSGVAAGKLPGGAAVKFYYLSADLAAGDLTTQMQISGRPNGSRRLTFELLGANARTAASAFVRSGFGVKDETTKTFAIDAAGRYIMRLIVEGDAPGNFCLLMGGAALPGAGAPECPAVAVAATPSTTEVAPPPPASQAPPKAFEVIVTKCEERLRVRSDFLFDFDRADLFPEADAALSEFAHRRDLARKRVIVEGHTDGKGADGYNQRLSERRAEAVRAALIYHGMWGDDLLVHGFGKSRPIAPNQNQDGSDNPEGRQRNRRVELVVNTCS